MSVNELPSYVQQNLAMVQDNIKSIISETSQISGTNVSGVYDSVFNDILTTMSDAEFSSFSPSTTKNTSYAGASGNIPSSNQVSEYINSQNKFSTEKDMAIKKAYDSLMNGEAANNNSKIVSAEENDKNNLIEKINTLKNRAFDKDAVLITDKDFFNSTALSAKEIDNILAKKGSPYANQKFNGMTIGELIYKECQSAGTIQEGNHKLNPALVLSIMGAESSFGKDPKANKTNPFNIRVDGSFSKVTDLPTSLNMAVNTMYNWAMSRPENSKTSFFDFAGDKYCENYTEKWKPNVEKYFLEFTLNEQIASTKIPSAPKIPQQPDMTSILSSMSGLSNGGKAGGLMNMSTMMNMINSNKGNIPIDKMSLLSSMSPSSMIEDREE
ncbi:MAG: hypothetical protein U0457_15550 [Candidatus Sericytochromatia bacterium]